MAFALALLGWVPMLYRRFSHDDLGRPIGRALLAGLVISGLAQLVADVSFRYPLGWLLPLLLLLPPIFVNMIVVLKYVFRRAWRKPKSS